MLPDKAYDYRISVVNTDGYESPTTESGTAGFSIAPVQLLSAEADSSSGVVRLTWSRFAGSAFEAYEVRRRDIDADEEVLLDQVTDASDSTLVDDAATADVIFDYTVSVSAGGEERSRIFSLNELTYTDSSIHGNTEYFYTVEVITDRDETAKSQPRSDIIHPLVEWWDLDVAVDDVVRLYSEADGVTALVAGRSLVRTLYFDRNGQIIDEQALVPHPSVSPVAVPTILPRSVSFARALDGRRFLGYSAGQTFRLFEFSVAGSRVVGEPQALLADSLAGLRLEAAIAPEVSIRNLHGNSVTAFDNLNVLSDEGVLLHEDFDQGMPQDWESVVSHVRDGWLLAGGAVGLVARFSDGSWQDFGVEFDVAVESLPTDAETMGFQIQLGRSTPLEETVLLKVDWLSQLATFTYGFQVPFDSELEGINRQFNESLSLLRAPTIHRVVLELSNGDVRASIAEVETADQLWSGERVDVSAFFVREENGVESVGFTTGDASYSATGVQIRRRGSYDTDIYEARSWTIIGSDDRWVGVCLPNQHQVILRPSSRSVVEWPNWPATLSNDRSRSIGLQLGEGDGDLLIPMSFDASADGRIYILYAGNGRIQVFDPDAAYITQWGIEGSGDGEFDFGSGAVAEDFGGSIAVDDAGFIYVWDPGNRRIQKFAP